MEKKERSLSKQIVFVTIGMILASVVFKLCVPFFTYVGLYEVSPKLNEEMVTGCTVVNAELGEVELDRDQYKLLSYELQDGEYRYEGRAGDELKGNIYHVHFRVAESVYDSNLEVIEIAVSDEEVLYTEGKKYKMKENQVLEMIENAYAGEF